MAKYILKRLIYIIPTFIVLSLVVFVILASAGDPVNAILGPSATEEQIAATREELGLNDNIIVRYVNYVKNVCRGDFGTSWTTRVSIFDEFSGRLPNTLKLTAYAIIFAIIFGIPLGVLSAVKQYSVLDKTTMVVAMVFISLPSFFLALMAQIVFALNMGILPAVGADSFKNFIMPAVVLGAAQAATLVRMTRSSMLDVIQQDYIRTARAKGNPKFRYIFRHALRNALLPVITTIGNTISAMVAGSVVVETVFSIPGIGSMLINGVRVKDVPMVMGPIIFVSLMVCAVNLLVDILYAVVDPRVRAQFSGKRVSG